MRSTFTGGQRKCSSTLVDTYKEKSYTAIFYSIYLLKCTRIFKFSIIEMAKVDQNRVCEIISLTNDGVYPYTVFDRRVDIASISHAPNPHTSSIKAISS